MIKSLNLHAGKGLLILSLLFACSQYEEEQYNIGKLDNGVGSLLESVGSTANTLTFNLVSPDIIAEWPEHRADSLINNNQITTFVDSIISFGADTLTPGNDILSLISDNESYSAYGLLYIPVADEWISIFNAAVDIDLWTIPNGTKISYDSNIIPPEIIVSYNDVIKSRYIFTLNEGYYIIKLTKSENYKSYSKINSAIFQKSLESLPELDEIAQSFENVSENFKLISTVEIDTLQNINNVNNLLDSSYVHNPLYGDTSFYDLMLESITTIDNITDPISLSFNTEIENLNRAYIFVNLNSGNYTFYADANVDFLIYSLPLYELTIESGISILEALSYPIKQKATITIDQSGLYLLAIDKSKSTSSINEFNLKINSEI
ncbi:MAG: hypothetical protein KAI81_08030 [Candidatus Marinimicrobia bacterium]|nr:hypothetical protein [Candidatus Neomarinimicrobiota bacterium]